MGLALAVVLAAASPASLAVELLGREAPREVRVSGAASVTCDGRTVEAAGAVHLAWTPGAVVIGPRAGRPRRCKGIQLVPAAAGHAPRGESHGGAGHRGAEPSIGAPHGPVEPGARAFGPGPGGLPSSQGDVGTYPQGLGAHGDGVPVPGGMRGGLAPATLAHTGASAVANGPETRALLRKNVHAHPSGSAVPPAVGGTCGSRAGLVLEVGRLRRCYEGSLRAEPGARALRLVLRLPLETYVASVVASEAGDAPPEAQAAQAVVTRTWALAHLRRHGDADACDLTHCQLFRGAWVDASERAAARTEGQVLRRGDSLLPSFFHAACGGHTVAARAAFGEPGPEGIPDLGPGGRAWCTEPPWIFTVPHVRLARALGLSGNGSVRVVERTPDGRALEVEAFGRRLAGPLFVARVGRALGYGTLRSTRFRVESDGTRLHFRGEGRGHGVGFCQAGASARARAGQRWQQLLEAYFPGAEVARAGRAISPPQ